MIAGDSGLLGQAMVQEIAAEKSNRVLGISSSPFQPTPFCRPIEGAYEHQVADILKERERISELIKAFDPEVVVNCIALIRLEDCEKDPEQAEQLNRKFPEMLAKETHAQGRGLIHISTDQVFDGLKNTPYGEEDPTHPLHEYGKSKLEGERSVLKYHPDALVVRTNIVGFRDRPGRPTFVEWLWKGLREKASLNLFEDYITSPIHVRLFSERVRLAYGHRLKGIFHMGARDAASKYQFGERLAHVCGFDFSNVKRASLHTSGLLPPRPPYLALDESEIECRLGSSQPSIDDTIRELAGDIRLRFEKHPEYASR